jgi:hypothetical protein
MFIPRASVPVAINDAKVALAEENLAHLSVFSIQARMMHADSAPEGSNHLLRDVPIAQLGSVLLKLGICELRCVGEMESGYRSVRVKTCENTELR